MEETALRILVLGITIGCIYTLIGIGLNLLWGTMRILNVAHGSLIMLGAYVAYWLFTFYSISPFIGAIIAIGGGAALGLLIYKALFSTIIRKEKSVESLEIQSYLIFFGFLIILDNAASLAWSANYRSYTYLVGSVNILGMSLPLNRLIASLVAIGVSLGFHVFLQRTLFGKAVRALIQDRYATEVVGVRIDRVYIFCFCSGFAMAGLSGTLLSLFYAISPYMGLPYALMAFVIVIIGGSGNMLGSLIGGILLGVIMTAGVHFTAPTFSPVILYLVFVLVILFKPAGILGRRLR